MASHSLDNTRQSSDALARANRQLSDMIFTGRSFSGRESHCAFLNVAATAGDGPQFARVSAVSGLDLADDGRSVVLVDWDLDGDLDMWISNRNAPRLRFLRNDAPTDHHFLAVRLVGNGKTTNRDAIGARVEVYLDDPDHKPMIKTLHAGEGFLGQSSKWLHFGLGDAKKIKKLIVKWPAGDAETFTDLQVDSRYRLVQGSRAADPWSVPARTLKIVPAAPKLPNSADAARIPLAYRLPMVRVPYEQFDGTTKWARFNKGKPVLLNLWASWCRPCLAELQELTDRSDELRAAGIEVLALSVDGMKDDGSKAAAVSTARRIGLPFEVGRATPQLLRALEQMHHRQIPMRRQLPLPTSFLIDANGQLAVIYKGPLTVDVLLADVKNLEGTSRQRFVRSAAFPGRTIDHPKIDLARRRTETLIRFRLANVLEQLGRFPEAAIHYRGVVELSPTYAEAHNNLGNVLDRLRAFAAAESHLRLALKLKPDFAFAHHNLGNVLLHQGSFAAALQSYRKAVDLDSQNAGFHFSYGNALFVAKQPIPSVIASLKQATQLNPRFEQAQFLLGVSHERIGKPQQAIEYYRRTLAINPDHVDAKNSLRRLTGGRK